MAGDTEFFSLCEEELGGTRPDRLAGVRPQVWVVQRTVEQIVDPVPVVPLLHDAEPQVVEHLVDQLSLSTISRFPSRASKCPRSSLRTSRRRLCREPQLAEQRAEVPTILHFLKQTVDSPVPGRGGVEGGQQGFLPGQSSSSSAGRGRSGGLHGFLPGQGSLQRTGEQIIDTPARGRGGNFLSFALALFALEIWCFISIVLVSGCHCSSVWVLLMSAKIGFFGR